MDLRGLFKRRSGFRPGPRIDRLKIVRAIAGIRFSYRHIPPHEDVVFQISADEWQNLKYQIGTSSSGHGGRRRRPYVFTEHGAIMAANVLNSPRAIQMAVFVVRAFLKMRALLGDKRELAQKLASLEKDLKKRLDVHEAVIVTILQRVMDIIDPPLAPQPPKPRIGFRP